MFDSRTDINPTAIKYSKQSIGILGLLLQVFSIIGGIFMIAKVVDVFLATAFVKPQGFTEVNPGTELM